MKLSDYLKIKPSKTMFGKRTGTYRASLGEIGFDGKDKQEAIENLCRIVKSEFDNMYTRKYLTKNSVTFVLFYGNGWNYDIFHHETGQVGSCALSCKTYNEALKEMTNHFNQYES